MTRPIVPFKEKEAGFSYDTNKKLPVGGVTLSPTHSARSEEI